MSQSVEPQHPGIILLEQVMIPLGVSRNKLARDIDVPVGRISDIVNGKRGISADTALRLAKYFGTAPELWMRLQSEFDLYVARCTSWHDVEPRVRIFEANGEEPHDAAVEEPIPESEDWSEEAPVPSSSEVEPPPMADQPVAAEPPPYPPVEQPLEPMPQYAEPEWPGDAASEPPADLSGPDEEVTPQEEIAPVDWQVPAAEPVEPVDEAPLPDAWAPSAPDIETPPETEELPAWSAAEPEPEAPPVSYGPPEADAPPPATEEPPAWSVAQPEPEAPPVPDEPVEAEEAPTAYVEDEAPVVEPSVAAEPSEAEAESLGDERLAPAEAHHDAAEETWVSGWNRGDREPVPADEAEARAPMEAVAPAQDWPQEARDVETETERFSEPEEPAPYDAVREEPAQVDAVREEPSEAPAAVEAPRIIRDKISFEDDFLDDDVLLLTEEVGPDEPVAEDLPPFDRSDVMRRVRDLGFLKRRGVAGTGENIVPFASSPDRVAGPTEEFGRPEPGEPAVRPATRLAGFGDGRPTRPDDDKPGSLDIPDPTDVGPLVRRD